MPRYSSLALCALISALAFDGSAAFAGGSLKDEPAHIPEAYDWNGFSVGVGIGMGSFGTDVWAKGKQETFKRRCWPKYGDSYSVKSVESMESSYDVAKMPTFKCREYEPYGYNKYQEAHASKKAWEWFGTMRLGYDRLLHQRFLIGAFADFDFYKNADHTFHVDTIKSWGGDEQKKGGKKIGSLSGRLSRDNIWTIGGRLGYLVQPRLLAYGLAGYSQMKMSGALDVDFAGYKYGDVHSTSFNIDKKLDGYTLGGGVEVKIDKRVSLQFEYRYMNFGGFTAGGSKTHTGDVYGVDCNSPCKSYYQKSIKQGGNIKVDDMDEHSVRAVLVLKLGDHTEPHHVSMK